MQTSMVLFDGVPLIVPVVNNSPLEIPYKNFEEFPSFCGAGKGIGDFIVPETVLWLKITPACYLHDIGWELADPTWMDFHAYNSMFRSNIDSIIHYKSNNTLFEHLRYYKSVTFFSAVDTLGAYFFWKIKRIQGYTGTLDKDVRVPNIKSTILPNLGLKHSWIKIN